MKHTITLYYNPSTHFLHTIKSEVYPGGAHIIVESNVELMSHDFSLAKTRAYYDRLYGPGQVSAFVCAEADSFEAERFFPRDGRICTPRSPCGTCKFCRQENKQETEGEWERGEEYS